MAAYQAGIAGTNVKRQAFAPRSVGSLVDGYLKSSAVKNLSKGSQET
jgi:hypothetical protein